MVRTGASRLYSYCSTIVSIFATRSGRPSLTLWVPAVLLVCAMALPVAYLLAHTLRAAPELDDLLLRRRTLDILIRSVILVAGVTVTSTIIAVPMAWLTSRTDLPFRRMWTILTALPLVVPSYIGAFLVVVALGPRGMLQGVLEGPFGVDRLPDIYGLPGALLTLTLLSYPYILLPVRAALINMDSSLEEGSRSLGHGSWRTFLRITLPILRPAIAAGGLLVALYTLSDFGAVSILRYETFTWAIYIQYDSSLDRTIAAALSLLLVLVAVIILVMESLTRGKARYYRSTAFTSRPPKNVHLGQWRWPALSFCILIVLLALGLPLSVLGYWVVQGASSGESLSNLWAATISSLSVSAIAAVATIMAGVPVALLVVRFPSRAARLLERSSYIGFALPGIVVSLALVFFGSQFAYPIYQTLVLLIFAYVMLFLPASVGAIRVSLLQINPRIEEAARSLGKTPTQALQSITLPLLRSGLLAGAALVFLLTMKELPASLILAPIGFKTLSTSIWSASSEAFYGQAATHSLVLILVSSIPMAFLIFKERRLDQ